MSRLPVHGQVPDAVGRSGQISLIPLTGTEAPSARVAVRDGLFHFDESNGPMPGNYAVLVELHPKVDTDSDTVKVKGIDVPVSALDGLTPDELEERRYQVSVASDGSMKVILQ